MRSRLAERTLRARELGFHVTAGGTLFTPQGNTLQGSPNQHGYLKFSVPRMDGDSDRTVYIHQLAALQWYGRKALAPGKQVRHLDEDRSNNSKSNIAVGTNSINQMDIDPVRRRERAAKASRAAVKKTRKFSNDEVRDIRSKHSKGTSIKNLARGLAVSTATISYIVNGKTYANVA